MGEKKEHPTCRDGFDRNHFMVEAKGRYKSWAWLGLLTGVSVRPYKIVFKCSKCHEEFDESQDPELLSNHYLS